MKEKTPMQSWAKRGLQTALVTGGLFMLGTGIASADENVNPDVPPSPLDLNVTVPISEANNAIGTPFGQLDLPAGETELSTKPVTKAVNEAAKQLDDASPISKSTLGAANGGLRQSGNSGAGVFTPGGENLKGNKVTGDVVVPIQIVDNAIGVIGDANVAGGSHQQTWSHNQDVQTEGKNSGIAGNVVALDWAAPIQLAGNGVGVIGGSGAVHGGSASQSTTETGNVTTTGKGSALSGNVVPAQFATPVQISGNAVSYILGNAYSEYDADTTAKSGGWVLTDGEGGSAAGNVVGAPIALPVKFNGNAAGVWGSDADTVSNSSADATAGGKRKGSLNNPTYIETNGDKSFLDGNVVAPQGGLVANVAGVAGSWIGNSTTGNALGSGKNTGSSASTVDSGGFIKTAGDKAAGAGNIVDPAIALPVEVFGVGATYIGNSHASHDNATDANAGSGSYTRGNDSLLAGNTANTASALTAEVFGVGGSHIGNATGHATEEKTVTTGGYDGTQGNNSSASGNLVQVPVGLPAEVFGIGGSFIGQGAGAAEETKVIRGGGGGNTEDDFGAISSNLAAVPVSLPVQVFGVGGAVAGQGHGKASTDTTSTAGGDVHATGPLGAIAGNIAQVPVSLPVQGHGAGAALGGIGTGASDNLTDSTAGGDAATNGHDGGIAGNIAQVPVGGVATVFGDGAAVGALGHGAGVNDVMSAAGGDSATNGDRGALAGNIISGQALPIAQVFGDAASLGGAASGDGVNTTSATSGGDTTTSGVEGAISGDLIDIPVAAVPQVFGDAVTVGGVAKGLGDNQTVGTVGGVSKTVGEQTSLSGVDGQVPVGALVQVFGVPLELVGSATALSQNSTVITDEPQINLPIDGSELGVKDLPALPALGNGALPIPAGALGTERADVPGINGLPIGSLPVGSLNGLALLQNLGHLSTPTLPGQSPRADLPGANLLPIGALPTGSLTGLALPTVPQLPAVGSLPVALPTTGSLPSVGSLPVALPTTGALPVALPTTGTLPVALPTTGALPVALPTAAALPVLKDTKATPNLQTPALAQMDSSPLNIFKKALASLTGKKFHTQ